MSLQIVRYAADGIVDVPQQVSSAVSVEIDRKITVATRHKLRDTHGARIRTPCLQHPNGLLFTSEQKVLLQLGAKEIGAWRVVERERRESVEHTEGACVFPVVCFDSDDGDDELLRDSEFAPRLRQGLGVFVPKPHSPLHSGGIDKHRPVVVPWFALGGLGHRSDDAGLIGSPGE